MAQKVLRVKNKPAKPSSFFKSYLPGIAWPAIPDDKSAKLLAILLQLEKSQWWSPEKLRQTQLTQVFNLLIHAAKTVPYYKDKLSFLEGVEKLTETLWSRVPLLSRENLQIHENQLLSSAIPPSHGIISEIRTSGSTGRPVRVKRTETFLVFHDIFNLREHFWLTQDPIKCQMAIRRVNGLHPNTIRVQNSWGPPYDRIYNTNRSFLIDVTSSIEYQIEKLIEHRPDYLITYPSNLSALLLRAKPEQLEQLNLKMVRTLSETLPDGLREKVKERLGTVLVDVYSCHEASVMAVQCPEYEHYHVQSENVLLEVLNEENIPCEPGETGKVVVTSLHNFAMPLIRYSLDDYAKVGEPCSCGRGLPVLKRILGRSRNMVTLPDGSLRWPTIGALSIADIAPISQIQVIQKSVEEIEARLVAARPIAAQEEQQIIKSLQESLGHPFRTILTYMERIPRNQGGKFDTFLSLI